MIEIDGKVYRNIQEQVQENMDNIETLQSKRIYAHSILINYYNSTTGDKLNGVAYFISNDNTPITKDNIITKLVAAGYDESSKRIVFSGNAYSSGLAYSCTLTSLARKTSSSTNITAYVYQASSGSVRNGSISIDTSDTTVTLDITDTVITL